LVVFFALLPPRYAWGKFFKLDGGGLRVIFAAFGQRVFVIPNLFRWARAIEEKKVRWNASIGGENSVRQSHDCMQLELFEQFLFNPGAYSVAKKDTIWHNHAASAAL